MRKNHRGIEKYLRHTPAEVGYKCSSIDTSQHSPPTVAVVYGVEWNGGQWLSTQDLQIH